MSLFACGASRALADDWVVALVAAAITCALCVMTIPLWPHIGLGGAGYHALRLALIGLALGCIPRASTLSCLFLSLLIGISDWMIDAHATGSGWHVLAEKHSYLLVLQDGIIMGVDAHPSANGQINSTLIFTKWLAKSEDAVLVPERVAFETACIREIGVFLRESFVDADL